MPRGVSSVPIPACKGPEPPCLLPRAGEVAQGRRACGAAAGKATLEQRLSLLEEKFRGLEAELQPVLSERRGRQPDGPLTHADIAFDLAESGGCQDEDAVQKAPSSKERHRQSARQSARQYSDSVREVSVQKSTWDLILFMGNLETGVLASVVTGAFIALNLVVQLTFSVILMLKFTARDTEAVHLATRWRETIGHAYLSSDNLGNSLVSRVCEEDLSLHISGQQLDSFSTAREYADPIVGDVTFGSVICIGCILAWCLSIAVEIKRNWLSTQAIWQVERSQFTDFEVVGEQLKLKSIGFCKVGFVTFLAIVRLGVALMLAYSGSAWLSSTKSIGEIILNAVALNFVLEIDEFIYDTMIPLQVAKRAQRLKPLELPRTRWSWQGLDARTALLILGTFTSVAALSVGLVLPRLSEEQAIQDALCGGDRHFVLESHAPTGIILGFHTPISGQGPPSGAAETLMQEVASNLVARHRYPKEHFEMESWSDFVSARSMSLGEYMDAYGTCVDFGTNDTHLSAALRSVLGRPDVTSCGDLDRRDCSLDHPITRLACPVTCKCSTPMSGVYRLEGCPLKHCAASESYRKVIANGRNADVHAAVLSSMPDWIHYWKGYSDFMREHPEAQLLLDLEPRVVQDQFLKLGCGAVDEVGKAHPFRSKSFIRDFFCSEMDSKRRPLSAFCPDTCGCSEDGSEDKYFCPRPLDNDLRSRDHLEFIVPGPPNCSVTAFVLFQDTPAEYNHRSLYRFTEKASGITWEIRWETELDYGGAFLGTTALPKWTLTGYGAGSSRSWHAFGQGSATLPQPTGWLLASNASNASGPWGCPTVFAEMLRVSWKLDRSGVTCANKVRAPASSVEACADACIDQAGADCTWFFWIAEECFLPRPGCQIKYEAQDGGNIFRRLTSLRPCHDFTGIYFTQSGSIVHVRQAGCSLEVRIGGNAAAGTFVLDSGNATAGTARRGSVFLEGGLGNGTVGPGIWDRDVYFTSAEHWKRVYFSSQNTAGDGARSCQDRGQLPVMSHDLCIAFAQEVGTPEPWAGNYPGYRRGCYYWDPRSSWSSRLHLSFNEHPNASLTSPFGEIGVCMSTEAN